MISRFENSCTLQRTIAYQVLFTDERRKSGLFAALDVESRLFTALERESRFVYGYRDRVDLFIDIEREGGLVYRLREGMRAFFLPLQRGKVGLFTVVKVLCSMSNIGKI